MPVVVNGQDFGDARHRAARRTDEAAEIWDSIVRLHAWSAAAHRRRRRVLLMSMHDRPSV